MGATLVRVDGVGERVHRFGVSTVPLHGHLELVAGALGGEADDGVVDGGLAVVQVSDEVLETTRVVVDPGTALLLRVLRLALGIDDGFVGELGVGGFLGQFVLGLGCLCHVDVVCVADLDGRRPLVGEGDGQAFVEKGHFLQAARDGVEVVGGGLEDLLVGPVSDSCAGLLGGRTLLERSRNCIGVGLLPRVAGVVDLQLDRLRQCVHHRDSDTVQTTGHRIRV